jgi:tuftelin-interacting protein 11
MFGHEWNPLKTPQLAVAELKKFRKHFLIDKDVVQQSDGMEVDMYGSASAANGGTSKRASDRSMTAYETMMWTIWLPRVRSDIK